jgi:hypothetical protein
MSNIHIPLTIPSSLVNKTNYSIQFSLHNIDNDNDIFIETLYDPSDLTAGQNGNLTASLSRGQLPRFNSGGDVELRAHFWKGQKFIESVDCGRI